MQGLLSDPQEMPGNLQPSNLQPSIKDRCPPTRKTHGLRCLGTRGNDIEGTLWGASDVRGSVALAISDLGDRMEEEEAETSICRRWGAVLSFCAIKRRAWSGGCNRGIVGSHPCVTAHDVLGLPMNETFAGPYVLIVPHNPHSRKFSAGNLFPDMLSLVVLTRCFKSILFLPPIDFSLDQWPLAMIALSRSVSDHASRLHCRLRMLRA